MKSVIGPPRRGGPYVAVKLPVTLVGVDVGFIVGVAVGFGVVSVGVDATAVRFALCWARAVALMARSTVGVAAAVVFEGEGGDNTPSSVRPPSMIAMMMSQAFR